MKLIKVGDQYVVGIIYGNGKTQPGLDLSQDKSMAIERQKQMGPLTKALIQRIAFVNAQTLTLEECRE